MSLNIRSATIRSVARLLFLGVPATVGLLAASGAAFADKIKNPTAVFSGLDKITGRTISFEAGIGETVQFGSLQITPRVCYTRPATEAPETDTFVQVDEVTSDKQYKPIFSGWMFAASPGLHGIEHPVYDIWLTACKGGTEVIHDEPATTVDAGAPPAPGAPASDQPAQADATKPPPKPRRVVRVAPRPEQEPRRQPSQSFFPTTDFPSQSDNGSYGKNR